MRGWRMSNEISDLSSIPRRKTGGNALLQNSRVPAQYRGFYHYRV